MGVRVSLHDIDHLTENHGSGLNTHTHNQTVKEKKRKCFLAKGYLNFLSWKKKKRGGWSDFSGKKVV